MENLNRTDHVETNRSSW